MARALKGIAANYAGNYVLKDLRVGNRQHSSTDEIRKKLRGGVGHVEKR